jgi:uncharacterized protein with NRDE domain
MCLVNFSFQYPNGYDLILASNRDEFISRLTLKADYWEENSSIWGGKDLVAGGTWLGITKEGRFAFVTNYRNLYLPKPDSPLSRGNLCKDYLLSNQTPFDYLTQIMQNKDKYEGFNLILGNSNSCFYYNNKRNILSELKPGIYSVSNGILDEPWPKLIHSKSKFIELIQKDNLSPENFFAYLNSKEKTSKEFLPDTGIGEEREKALSSCFIDLETYGTRSSFFISKKLNEVPYCEEKFYR